jgi:cytochrome c6
MKAIYASAALLAALVPAVAAGVRAEEAAKIFTAKCAACHGKNGKGNPAMAKAFKLEPGKMSLVSEASLKKTDAELVKITTEGHGKMPAYKGKLTDTEIQNLVIHIRSLAPK